MSTQYHSRIIPLHYSGYRTCGQCDSTFYPEEAGQTVCKLCRVEMSYKCLQERRRDAERERRGYVPQPRTCAHCGAPYTPSAMARGSKFCSRPCKLKHRAEQEAVRHTERTCEECSAPFLPKRKDQQICNAPACLRARERRRDQARRKAGAA